MENTYMDLELTQRLVADGEHRSFIGGMWNEIGTLQFEYLKSKGLKPAHKLLDVGCGSLRGGVHFVSYLNSHNYYGFDLNASLIEAGINIEIANLGLRYASVLKIRRKHSIKVGVFMQLFLKLLKIKQKTLSFNVLM